MSLNQQKLKLGIIGMNAGNGHPYSWSAIFNGYDPQVMKNCPFPAISEYLDNQKFPEDSLCELGQVTHIWTQEKKVSEHIAKASKIHNIVDEMIDMIGVVDAVLLARDDAENHYQMALPFLKAGLPVFIDKPLALSEKEAVRIFNAQKYEGQIFSCSPIRYAIELKLSIEESEQIGEIKYVEASVPNGWDKYAVHLIETMITQLPKRGYLKRVSSFQKNKIKMCVVEWENIVTYLKVTGSIPCPLKMIYFGEKGYIEKNFVDTYNSFKKSLEIFVGIAKRENKGIDKAETIEIIQILEKGRN